MSGADLVPGSRHAVAPSGIVSTAWPRIARTCNNIGWRFDPWQDATGRLILAKKDGGNWAADLSILSIPRQVGKSYLLGCIIFALCLLNPKLRVIWTSHHTATTEEMYEAMKELAQHKRVKPHVVKCIALQGSRWRIQFRNGSRIDFGARSQGFGRGKAKVGVLVLDEFQHITSRALANLTPTTNTADNPLILCAGTPPGPDVPGEAFALRRKAALEGISDDTLYVEFSADSAADPDDRKQWAKANPSFPRRTGERAFLLMRKMLTEDDFIREGLGIWDDDSLTTIPMQAWAECADAAGKIDGQVILSLDMSFDRSRMHIGVCGQREDERRQVEIDVRPTGAVIRSLADAAREFNAPVMVAATGPAAAFIPEMRDAGINVVEVGGAELAQACGHFYDSVVNRSLAHLGDEGLATAVRGAQRRTGESYVFTRKGDVDISPLYAALLALWGWTSRPSGDILQHVW